MAEVSILKKETKPIGSGSATLISTSCHLTVLLKSLLFWEILIDKQGWAQSPIGWREGQWPAILAQGHTFELCVRMQMSTFSLLFEWNLCFLFTFLLKSPLSLYFSVEISTCSLLPPYFSAEIFTFSFLFWNLVFTFLLKPLLSLYFPIATAIRKAIMPCFPQCNYAPGLRTQTLKNYAQN